MPTQGTRGAGDPEGGEGFARVRLSWLLHDIERDDLNLIPPSHLRSLRMVIGAPHSGVAQGGGEGPILISYLTEGVYSEVVLLLVRCRVTSRALAGRLWSLHPQGREGRARARATRVVMLALRDLL